MHPVEFTWYKALVLLTSAMAIGFGILNIVYFNRIRIHGNCSEVSTTDANVVLWLNLILVIFAAITFFWPLFRLIHTGEVKEDKVNTTYNDIRHSPDVSIYTRTSPIPIPSPSSSNVLSPNTSPLNEPRSVLSTFLPQPQ